MRAPRPPLARAEPPLTLRRTPFRDPRRPLESGAPDPADEETDEAVAATPSVLQFFKRSADAGDAKPSAGAKRARTGLWGSMGLRAVTDL